MARGRMLSKSLSTSEKRAALHGVAGRLAEFAQQLYPLLLAHADDYGRQHGDIFTVKHAIDPSSPRSDADFALALKCLHNVGLIVWYEVGERKFIQITNFDQHQAGLHKRTAPRFPEVPGNSGKFRDIPSQQNLTELNRTELKISAAAADPPLRARSEPEPDNPEEHVEVITQVVLKDVIPVLGPNALRADYVDVTKERCARLKIAYDSASVGAAVDSALIRWKHNRSKAKAADA
jgi:hypothetical protein